MGEHPVMKLDEYSRVVIAFSGGKDSRACLLHLLELNVPRIKIKLQHHAEPNDCNWDYPVRINNWQLPSGAFGESAGPS